VDADKGSERNRERGSERNRERGSGRRRKVEGRDRDRRREK
jgi:hypothetical protein